MNHSEEMHDVKSQLTLLSGEVAQIKRAVIGEEVTGQVGLVSKVDNNMARIEEVNDSLVDFKHKDDIRMAKFSGAIIIAGIGVEFIKVALGAFIHS